MNILHGIWIPEKPEEFFQSGNFCLWVETDNLLRNHKQLQAKKQHPYHLGATKLPDFLKETLEIKSQAKDFSTETLCLPTQSHLPLPSSDRLELGELIAEEDQPTWQEWQVDCYRLDPVIKGLRDLHFRCSDITNEVMLGTDFMFWYQHSQFIKQIIYKDQYIPALVYREKSASRKTKNNQDTERLFSLYNTWSTEFIPLAVGVRNLFRLNLEITE